MVTFVINIITVITIIKSPSPAGAALTEVPRGTELFTQRTDLWLQLIKVIKFEILQKVQILHILLFQFFVENIEDKIL